VKLLIDERESEALEAHLATIDAVIATSQVALVEVPRAASLADPDPAVRTLSQSMLATCLLVDLDVPLLRAAARLTSRALRTLDAIHLASALRAGADEMLVYDRKLGEAARAAGLLVSAPGRGSS